MENMESHYIYDIKPLYDIMNSMENLHVDNLRCSFYGLFYKRNRKHRDTSTGLAGRYATGYGRSSICHGPRAILGPHASQNAENAASENAGFRMCKARESVGAQNALTLPTLTLSYSRCLP